jgi:oxygen-independent coproporphyrinogen-3 oxidase
MIHLPRRRLKRKLHRNFQGYVAKPVGRSHRLWPLGHLSSAERLRAKHFHIGAWRRAVEANTLAVSRGHAQSAEDLRRGAVIQSIMCNLEVDLGAVGRLGHAFPEALRELRPLRGSGPRRDHGDILACRSTMRTAIFTSRGHGV